MRNMFNFDPWPKQPSVKEFKAFKIIDVFHVCFFKTFSLTASSVLVELGGLGIKCEHKVIC
jgi:hypothetical protein